MGFVIGVDSETSGGVVSFIRGFNIGCLEEVMWGRINGSYSRVRREY